MVVLRSSGWGTGCSNGGNGTRKPTAPAQVFLIDDADGSILPCSPASRSAVESWLRGQGIDPTRLRANSRTGCPCGCMPGYTLVGTEHPGEAAYLYVDASRGVSAAGDRIDT